MGERQRRLARRLEKARIRLHLLRAETLARRAAPEGLSEAQERARTEHLDRLAEYRRRGVFPRNEERPGRTPVFVDGEGRECAVAHLMLRSGAGELVERVRREANLARVPDIRTPGLDEWAREAGLSAAELTCIQPGYESDPEWVRAQQLKHACFWSAFAARYLLYMLGTGLLLDWSRIRWTRPRKIVVGALALLLIVVSCLPEYLY